MSTPAICSIDAVIFLSIRQAVTLTIELLVLGVLLWLLASDAGESRSRAKLIQQALDNGVDPFWLGDDGGRE